VFRLASLPDNFPIHLEYEKWIGKLPPENDEVGFQGIYMPLESGYWS
jgi:hypothetical protein